MRGRRDRRLQALKTKKESKSNFLFNVLRSPKQPYVLEGSQASPVLFSGNSNM